MKNVTKWMLAAAMAIGLTGLATTPASAAQVRVYLGVGGPDYSVPPSPGPGYVWVSGYYANGYWIPGRWAWAGNYVGQAQFNYAPGNYRDRDDWNRNRDDRNHDAYRGRDDNRGQQQDRRQFGNQNRNQNRNQDGRRGGGRDNH